MEIDENHVRQLEALREVTELLCRDGIECWLFGGWAVDFHAGRITRSHDDLDVAVWDADAPALARLLAGARWRHVPDPHEDGSTCYVRDGVRLELAFLARADDGVIYTPLRDGRASWPDGTFGSAVAVLHGVRAPLVGAAALREDKSRPRDDPRAAAKDRADVATLAVLDAAP